MSPRPLNERSLAMATRILADCATMTEKEMDFAELMRFSFYYALKVKHREEDSVEWLEKNRPDVAAKLDEPANATAAESEDPVQAAIELANRATVLQARMRGKKARGKAKERAADSTNQADKSASLWGLAFAEQRKQTLSKLKMENEYLKRQESIVTTRLQESVARLEAENASLRAELDRHRTQEESAPSLAPAVNAEERLAALNWLVRSKSQPKI